MRTDGEQSGSGSASRGDGDPTSIREYTAWMGDLATAVDNLNQAVVEARELAGDGWRDSVGEAFCARMSERSHAASEYTRDIGQLANEFDSAAGMLESAHAKVDTARSYVAACDPLLVAVEDGHVMPPTVPVGPIPGQIVAQVLPAIVEGDRLEQALAQYEYIRELILSARDDIAPAVSALERAVRMFTARWYLHIAGVAAQRIEWYASQFRLHFIEQSWPLEHTRNTSAYFAELCRIHKASDVADLLDDVSREYGGRLNVKLTWASKLEVTTKLAHGAGYLTVIVGILLDTASGDTLDTATAKASPGIAFSIVGLAIGAPPGWVVALGIVGGIVVGDMVGEWYKRNVEHAPVPIDNSWCENL